MPSRIACRQTRCTAISTDRSIHGGVPRTRSRSRAMYSLPPWIDLSVEIAVQRVCLQAIREGIARSAHDLSEGGLAVALAEACMSGPGEALGAEIEMEAAIRPDAWLFGESQSRILLSVRRKHVGRLRDMARDADVPCATLGEVRGRRLRIGTLIDVSTADLRHTWTTALADRMAG